MLENGMTPSGVLWTDSEVSDTSFNRLQEQFNGKKRQIRRLMMLTSQVHLQILHQLLMTFILHLA